MIQNYSKYTKDDHEVWNILFSRQKDFLINNCYDNYLTNLERLSDVLNDQKIPDFDKLNEALANHTGWQIKVVAGIIPVDEFLALLSKKIFCSSTWIRDKKQLDYLKEPDMFHDIFGHIPFLIDEKYRAFTQALGELGVKYAKQPKIIKQLEALYWFTIEFGVMRSHDSHVVYGAGLISSYGETKRLVNNEATIYPYDLDKILNHGFDNAVMQQCYYAIEDISQLYSSLPLLEEKFEKILSDD